MKNLRVNGPSSTSPYIDNNNTQGNGTYERNHTGNLDYANHDVISSINPISKKEPFLMYGRNQTPSGILSHLPEGGSNFVTELSTPIIRNLDYPNNNSNNSIKDEFNKDRYIEAKNNLYARCKLILF